jgi:hypothetical protein
VEGRTLTSVNVTVVMPTVTRLVTQSGWPLAEATQSATGVTFCAAGLVRMQLAVDLYGVVKRTPAGVIAYRPAWGE